MMTERSRRTSPIWIGLGAAVVAYGLHTIFGLSTTMATTLVILVTLFAFVRWYRLLLASPEVKFQVQHKVAFERYRGRGRDYTKWFSLETFDTKAEAVEHAKIWCFGMDWRIRASDHFDDVVPTDDETFYIANARWPDQ
jgi:hypothetical protein